MQCSIELATVKDKIEGLLRDWHIIDKKLEEKTYEQNDLTEKCVCHLHVLRKKGMTANFYCPKKRGVTATPVKSAMYMTPTKQHTEVYAPNYFPSLRSYAMGAMHTAYSRNVTPVHPTSGIVSSYPLFVGHHPKNRLLMHLSLVHRCTNQVVAKIIHKGLWANLPKVVENQQP